MKQILFIALLWIGGGLAAQVNTYNVGDVVDNFTVTDTNGVQHTLYDITASGKYVFIDFFFTTCGPCQQTQKYFNELHDKYGCNEGELFAISISGTTGDTDEDVIQYEATYGGPFNHSPAVSMDGGGVPVINDFGINAFPTYCVIGPDNKLAVADIWPISNVSTYENAFPTGFDPIPMECSVMGNSDLNVQTFNLYPSVSNGQINLDLAKSIDSKISILSMNGQEVYKASFVNQKNIQLNLQLNPGIYILKLTTADRKVETQKFIIK